MSTQPPSGPPRSWCIRLCALVINHNPLGKWDDQVELVERSAYVEVLKEAKALAHAIKQIKLRLYEEQQAAHTIANTALAEWQAFKSQKERGG